MVCGGGHFTLVAQRGQQTGLRIAGVRQLDFVTEHAAGAQELRLRGDDVEARIHQRRAELRILPGGDGHVPAVDEHVDETVAGVYRARDRTVGDGAGA